MKADTLDTTGVEGLGVRTRVRIIRREELTPRVVLLDLAAAGGEPLRAGTAGAHVTLHLPSGLARQYSLCALRDDAYRIAVLREVDGRGGSVETHGLPVGTELELSGPRNSFPLAEAPRHLLVAGGIGITPLAAMAHELQDRGEPYRVVLAIRDLTDAPLARLLPVGCDVEVHVSGEGSRLDLGALLSRVDAGTAVYVCGPAPMLAEASSWSFALQRSGSSLHVEHFEASEDTLAGIHVPGDQPFRVTFARSGDDVTVEAGTSILAAARELGKVVDSSCEEGYCGTCETRVLSGTPDHRDDFLTPEEQESNETMMICVSRCASGDLVLDL